MAKGQKKLNPSPDTLRKRKARNKAEEGDKAIDTPMQNSDAPDLSHAEICPDVDAPNADPLITNTLIESHKVTIDIVSDPAPDTASDITSPANPDVIAELLARISALEAENAALRAKEEARIMAETERQKRIEEGHKKRQEEEEKLIAEIGEEKYQKQKEEEDLMTYRYEKIEGYIENLEPEEFEVLMEVTTLFFPEDDYHCLNPKYLQGYISKLKPQLMKKPDAKADKAEKEKLQQIKEAPMQLSEKELAKRLSLRVADLKKNSESFGSNWTGFADWSEGKDPDGLRWYKPVDGVLYYRKK